MKNLDMIIAAGLIAFSTGMAVTSVGQMPGPPEPFPWYLPFNVFLLMAGPAWFAYRAGKKSGER